MGCLSYWGEIAKRFPHLIAHYDQLSEHQEKPITIGGVGAGKVMITHVLAIHLPWMIGREPTKLVVGLGDNMPMTLLIGLPFQIAAKVSIDIGNLTCHSATFNTTWEGTLKKPLKKDTRTLDAVVMSGKKHAFSAVPITPYPAKKIRWAWDYEDSDQE